MDEETFVFGSFRLIPAQRMLLEDEKPLRLGSRALDILVTLVESAGETIGKDRLIARTWPDTIVDEGALRVHVAALRKALGDGRVGKRYIVNNPGRGYSFAAPVAREQRQPAIAPTNGTAVRGNLQALLTRIVGRDDIIAALAAQLARRRLLTLVGPGGVGKTTLALSVAQHAAGHFADGVVVIECGRIAADDATVPGPDLVTAAVWQALGANRVGRESQLGAIVRDLSRQQRLLVIDNAEHVADACARLVDHLTRSCPGLRVLVTSRRQLGLATELVWEVRPLALPEPDESDPERIRDSAAVQLLLRLARQVRAGARASEGEPSLDAVARVCRRLGGLPLALELAGARLRGISVADLARSLEDRSGEPQSARSDERGSRPRRLGTQGGLRPQKRRLGHRSQIPVAKPPGFRAPSRSSGPGPGRHPDGPAYLPADGLGRNL